MAHRDVCVMCLFVCCGFVLRVCMVVLCCAVLVGVVVCVALWVLFPFSLFVLKTTLCVHSKRSRVYIQETLPCVPSKRTRIRASLETFGMKWPERKKSFLTFKCIAGAQEVVVCCVVLCCAAVCRVVSSVLCCCLTAVVCWIDFVVLLVVCVSVVWRKKTTAHVFDGSPSSPKKKKNVSVIVPQLHRWAFISITV